MLDRVLARLGLIRVDNYIDSQLFLRDAINTNVAENSRYPGPSDRQWLTSSQIAHGNKP